MIKTGHQCEAGIAGVAGRTISVGDRVARLLGQWHNTLKTLAAMTHRTLPGRRQRRGRVIHAPHAESIAADVTSITGRIDSHRDMGVALSHQRAGAIALHVTLTAGTWRALQDALCMTTQAACRRMRAIEVKAGAIVIEFDGRIVKAIEAQYFCRRGRGYGGSLCLRERGKEHAHHHEGDLPHCP